MEARARRIAPVLGLEPSQDLLELVTSFWEWWWTRYPSESAGFREPNGPSALVTYLALRGVGCTEDAARECWSLMRVSAAEYPFELFADTIETLVRLRERGIATALVTNNYAAAILKPDLDGFGIRPDVIISSADVGYRKPHQLVFGRALQSLGMAASDVLMVGDSFENDVLGAKAAGITAVLKTNGREITAEERAESDYMIRDLSELFETKLLIT